MNISLDGAWKLAYAENFKFSADKPQINRIKNVTETGYPIIDAAVPGNFELDLQRAGIIGDPFYSANIIELQKTENYHLIYYRTFDWNGGEREAYIRFEGLDTVADIFINGKKIGHSENMLVPREFPVSNLKNGQNEIVIHIIPAVIAARDYEVPVSSVAMKYNFDSLYIRKAPHMYGWDIMPRAVSGGIWRGVTIGARENDRIDDVFFVTKRVDRKNRFAEILLYYNVHVSGDDLSVYRITVEGECGDSKFSTGCGRLWATAGILWANIGDVKLWMPRGYGEANMYDITVTLWKDGSIAAQHKLRSGIRTVALDRSSTTDKYGSGRFCFIVNGERIFVLGTNWVPVDAYHSRDRSRLEKIMPMLCDIGVNAVRCWGGNVYEDDYFFDFCDDNGIMIWQDFAMACAIYPQDKKFQDVMYDEVCTVVRRLRNHPAIILWAGDNECDESHRWTFGELARDPNENIITRRTIPDAIHLNDFTRPYLPSSPFVDEQAFRSGAPISEDHLWGPRDYFKGDYYNNTVCHFASETGYHGCPSPASLKKYIKPENLWHWSRKNDPLAPNDDWLAHAASMELSGGPSYQYRIKLMSDQVKTLFGGEGGSLDEFALRSQISQAEAKKYFIERFRVSMWRRTGIIWWNLIDGWPQISDAVVDYYGVKKLAYSYIKRSQSPFCLIFGEPESNADGERIPLYAVNGTGEDVSFTYEVSDLTADTIVTMGEYTASARCSERIYNRPIERGEQHFYLMRWKYGDTTGANHYMTNIKSIDADEYIRCAKKAGFLDALEGFDGEVSE